MQDQIRDRFSQLLALLMLFFPLVLSGASPGPRLTVGINASVERGPQGILVTLLQEVAAREGWILDYRTCVPAVCLDQLAAGEIDLLPGVLDDELLAWQANRMDGLRLLVPIQFFYAASAFLPLVEEQPLDAALGYWVLESALSQMSRWQRDGMPLSVSVNVSAWHLRQPNFISRLQLLLGKYSDVPPSRLELEVLESSALDDIRAVSSVMRDCAGLGVKFALDDFGTGYSTLTYLRRLPAQLLKVDQSFVRNMLHDEEDLAILEGVIRLAAAFQRQVIAEGVETRQHGEKLLSLGCELAQGYGIARPMPAKALPGWIRNWQRTPTWMA